MKKSFVITIIMCLASIAASAQWKVESVVSGEPNTKLLQVLETDKSVLVYATFERECEEVAETNLDRNIHVKVNGLKYKILNSVNLPIQDDSENLHAVLEKGKNEINFVMEFEKFPVEGGFDIIEGTEEGACHYNFHGVTVCRIDSTQLIDTDRFLDSGTPVLSGKNVRGGTDYLYLIRNGVCITCNAVVMKGDWFSSDDLLFYVDIVNNSDHGILFDFDKVRVRGLKKKKEKWEEKMWTKFTPESYDSYLARQDYDEARYKTSSVLDEIGRQIDRDKIHTNVNSWERIGLDALGAINQHAIDNRIEEYMKAHPKDRPKALRSESIKPGDSIHGYIASQKKKADKSKLTIPIDNYDFSFEFRFK